MRPNKVHIQIAMTVALLLMAALLAGCSGSVDVSIGSNVDLTLPPTQDSEPVVARGEITGLGGITLNDVRYRAGSATVTVNGNPAFMSDLRQGLVVTLEGRIDDNGQTGTADLVRYDANVIGPVEAIDADNRQLVVMGQTVKTDEDTRFGDGIDPWISSGMSVGDIAEISGHADASGAVQATRVDTALPGTQLQVIGTVKDLDPANLLFRINRLTIDYSKAVVIDLPGGAPANSMNVMVFGSINNGRLEVERLVTAPKPAGIAGERVQIAGIVTHFDSEADFDVDRVNVTAGSGTSYQNGVAADLDLNVAVVVDGKFARNGSITADRITFGYVVANTARLTYAYEDFTEIAVETVFTAFITQGADFSVEVFVDSGIEDRIEVTKEGQRLTLALADGDGNIRTLEAHVTMPALNRIELSGVSRASLYGFDQSAMTINVRGVSFLSGHDLRINNLTSSVSGVSRMDLVDVRPIRDAGIDISGVSQATLNMGVGSKLAGSVGTGQGSGASVLYYYGTNVDVDVTTDFLSTVEWLGHTRP